MLEVLAWRQSGVVILVRPADSCRYMQGSVHAMRVSCVAILPSGNFRLCNVACRHFPRVVWTWNSGLRQYLNNKVASSSSRSGGQLAVVMKQLHHIHYCHWPVAEFTLPLMSEYASTCAQSAVAQVSCSVLAEPRQIFRSDSKHTPAI